MKSKTHSALGWTCWSGAVAIWAASSYSAVSHQCRKKLGHTCFLRLSVPVWIGLGLAVGLGLVAGLFKLHATRLAARKQDEDMFVREDTSPFSLAGGGGPTFSYKED